MKFGQKSFSFLMRAILMIFFITSCGNEDNKLNLEDMRVLEINNNILLQWDVEAERFIQNDQTDSLREYYVQARSKLVSMISDTSETSLFVCDSINLRKGDLAFLIVDKMEVIPLATMLDMQIDYFELGCPYPKYLFNIIHANRALIVANLMQSRGNG